MPQRIRKRFTHSATFKPKIDMNQKPKDKKKPRTGGKVEVGDLEPIKDPTGGGDILIIKPIDKGSSGRLP